MRLTLRTWRKFVPNRNLRLEERITALFRVALIQAYEAEGRKWFITLEDPIVDPTFGMQKGRNDIRFYPPRHHAQTVFFTVECKRLHALQEPTAKSKQKAKAAGKPPPKPKFKHLVAEGGYPLRTIKQLGPLPCRYPSNIPRADRSDRTAEPFGRS
jgi:hypothetical protein